MKCDEPYNSSNCAGPNDSADLSADVVVARNQQHGPVQMGLIGKLQPEKPVVLRGGRRHKVADHHEKVDGFALQPFGQGLEGIDLACIARHRKPEFIGRRQVRQTLQVLPTIAQIRRRRRPTVGCLVQQNGHLEQKR